MKQKDDIVSSKRGFLKALSVAPLAVVGAKASIADAVQKAGGMGLGPGLSAGSGGYPVRSLDEASNLKSEIKWATERLLFLNTEGKELERMQPMLTACIQTDALRSVSPAVRLQIAEREASRIGLIRERSWAEKTIARAKKKLGILGMFVD